MGYVYIAFAEELGRSKIGYSSEPDARVYEIHRQSPCEIELIYKIKNSNAKKLESLIHKFLAEDLFGNEWFDLTPDDILTKLDVETLNEITIRHLESLLLLAALDEDEDEDEEKYYSNPKNTLKFGGPFFRFKEDELNQLVENKIFNNREILITSAISKLKLKEKNGLYILNDNISKVFKIKSIPEKTIRSELGKHIEYLRSA